MILQLPFTSDYAQSFSTLLGGVSYDVYAYWNERAQTWAFDLTVTATQVVLLRGIPILLGTDLLAPYDLGLGSLVAYDEQGTGRDAGSEDLGVRVNVYWFSSGLAS